MAGPNVILTKTFTAGAALGKNVLVKFGSADDTVVPATAATDVVGGVTEANLYNAPSLRSDPNDRYSVNMLSAYLGYNLDGSFTAPHFMVAVTCVVRGDQRLRSEPNAQSLASFATPRYKVIDLGTETFRVRSRRGQNSFLNALPTDPDPQYEGRNDAARLMRYGLAEARRMARDTVAGTIDVPYIKTDVRVGDSFSGVAGLGIAFSTFPEVVGIQHTKDPSAGYRTVYHLSDLRHAPEVGGE